MSVYKNENIFSKILSGEIPNNTIYENEYVLAFEDINPQSPVHALLIPKGKYTSMTDFSENASDKEIVAFIRAISQITKIKGINDTGYRIISNSGPDSSQEVPHLHFHIVGGRKLGSILP
ncbi:MAG: histidine triad nucleotide-binding protein [Pseudomonadota bacterium]|nr:histidine triad nucleotide-binding protein [Pseudomonadota bacterium]